MTVYVVTKRYRHASGYRLGDVPKKASSLRKKYMLNDFTLAFNYPPGYTQHTGGILRDNEVDDSWVITFANHLSVSPIFRDIVSFTFTGQDSRVFRVPGRPH
jgi:hypothetical protein